MLQFIFRKLFTGGLSLFGVVVLVFVLFMILPTDPARMTLGQRADVASVEAIQKELGLDKPKHIQFLYYLNDLSPISFHKDTDTNKNKYSYSKLFNIGENGVVFKLPYLRKSYQNKRNVSAILLDALPKTIILASAAIFLAIIFGVMFGIIASLKQFSFIDNSVLVTSILGISLPSYFSGIVLALIFGYLLADYTGLNYTGGLWVLDDYGDEQLILKNLILPAIALGIRPVAIITMLTRSSMLEVLSQDYIRTAYAKGLSYWTVIVKHALRNALNPVVTAVSGWFAGLLAGAYFVEIIFDFKGLGYVTIKAIETLDFPVVMGSVLFAAVIFVTINILVDIMYGVLDPRVSVK